MEVTGWEGPVPRPQLPPCLRVPQLMQVTDGEIEDLIPDCLVPRPVFFNSYGWETENDID